MDPRKYAKALAGAALAGLGAAHLGLNDGLLTVQEWVAVAQAGLAAGLAVYGIPNTAPGRRAAGV